MPEPCKRVSNWAEQNEKALACDVDVEPSPSRDSRGHAEKCEATVAITTEPRSRPESQKSGSRLSRLMRHSTKSPSNRSRQSCSKVTLNYTGLPAEVRNVISKWDTDQSGCVDLQELEAASRAQEMLHNRAQLYRRIAVSSLGICLLFGLMIFFLSYASMELAKDIHLGDGAVMVTASGEVVQTSNNEITVDRESGEISVRLSSTPENRRLQAECLANGGGAACGQTSTSDVGPALKTAKATMVAKFTSKLTQAQLSTMLMIRIMAASDVGTDQGLHLDVLSTVRQVALGSSCGHVYTVKTPEGSLVLDHEDVWVDPQLAEVLQAEGLIPDSISVSKPVHVGTLADFVLEGTFDVKFRSLAKEDRACNRVPVPKLPDGPQQSLWYDATLHHVFPDGSSRDVLQNVVRTEQAMAVLYSIDTQSHVQVWDLEQQLLTTFVLSDQRRLYCQTINYGEEIASLLFNSSSVDTYTADEWTFAGNIMPAFPKLRSVFHLEGPVGRVELTADALTMAPMSVRVLPLNANQEGVGRSPFAEVTFTPGSVRFNATLEEAQARLLSLGAQLWQGCGEEAELESASLVGGLSDGMSWVARESFQQAPATVPTPLSTETEALVGDCVVTCYRALLGDVTSPELALVSCMGAFDSDGECDSSHLHVSAELEDANTRSPTQGGRWGDVDMTVEIDRTGVRWPLLPDSSFQREGVLRSRVGVPLENLDVMGAVVQLPSHEMLVSTLLVGNPPRLQGIGSELVKAKLRKDAGEGVDVAALVGLHVKAPLCMSKANSSMLPASCQPHAPVELEEELEVLVPASWWMAPLVWRNERTLATGTWTMEATERTITDDSDDSFVEVGGDDLDDSDDSFDNASDFNGTFEDAAGPGQSDEEEDASISETPQYRETEQAVLSTFAAFSTSGEEPEGCWSSAAVACLARCPDRTIVDFVQCQDAVDRSDCSQYEYCPYVAQIEADTSEWTTKAELSSTLMIGTSSAFPPTIAALSQHLLDWMSAQPDISTFLTVAEPNELKSLLQQATQESLNGINLGVATAMADLAKFLIMSKTGGTSDRVAKILMWPSLAESRAAMGDSATTPLVAQDLVDALMIRAVASGEDFGGEEEERDPAIFIETPTTYSDVSFEVDMQGDESELIVTFKTVAVSLLFPGTNFKMVVEAAGLSISQTLAQNATHIDVLEDPTRKMELGGGKQVVVVLSKDDQDQSETAESDTWKVPAEGTQIYLGEVLAQSHQLPSWLPIDVMTVRTFTWDMSNRTLRLTCEGHIAAPTTDTSVTGYDILAHVDVEETGGSTTTKLSVEWINTTVVLNGVRQQVSNRPDETALAVMPSMSLLVDSKEHPQLVTTAANSSLTFLGVLLPVARHAEVSHLNLEVDLSTFALTQASLTNALFHLYAGQQPLPVKTEEIDTAQDGVVFEAKVPSLAVDELPFVVSSSGALVAMGRPSGTELLDLFFDSFHFALEEGDFEGGPEGIITGTLMQTPTSAVMTSLSLHLQRLLCHQDKEAHVKFQSASLQLNKGDFQVRMVLHDVEWDIHPGGSFPMLGNIGIGADSFTLTFPSTLILRDFPKTSSLGGDARLRMLEIEADGLSLTLPRMSQLDNTTLPEVRLEPTNFSGCSWREMEFSGDAFSMLEASPTLKGRLGRVVFANKQALQLTGEMPVTTTFSEGASAMFSVRLWGAEIQDEEGVTPILNATSEEQPPLFRLQVSGPAAFSSGGARRLKDWNALRRLQELTEIDGIPRRLSATVPADEEAKDSITASESVIILGGFRFLEGGVLADWLPMLEVSGNGVESVERRLLREATDPQNHPVARRLQALSYETCDLPKGSGIELEDKSLYSCETMIKVPALPAETEADLLISDESRCNLTSVINLTEDGFDPVVTFGQPLLKYILLQYAVPASEAETVSKSLTSDSLEAVSGIIIDMIGGGITIANIELLLTTLGIPNSMRNRYVRYFLEGALVWSGLPRAAAKSIANNATITDTATAIGHMVTAMAAAIGGDVAMHAALSALGVSNPEVVIMGPILAQAMQAVGMPASNAESLVYDITTMNCLQTKMLTPSVGLKGMLGKARALSELKASNFTAVCDLASIMCLTSDADLKDKYLKPMVSGRLKSLHVNKASVEAAVTANLLNPLLQVCKGSATSTAQADADTMYLLLANQANRTTRDAALNTVMDSQNVSTDLSRVKEMFRIWGIPSSALLDLSTASLYTAPEKYEDIAGLEALWMDAGFDFVGTVLVPILRRVCDAMGVSPDANWALQNNLAIAARPSGNTNVQQTVVTALSQLTAGLAGETGTNMCPVFLNLLESIDSMQLLSSVVSTAIQNTFEAFSIPSAVTNSVVTFLATDTNAKLFMGAPACSAIFARTSTIADFEAVMALVGESPTDAVFQPSIESSLVKMGATATQAAAFSSQATLLKLGDLGTGIMALMTRIGEPKSVGLEIFDILKRLDPADGTNTPVAVVQAVMKSKLVSLGVAEAVATSASQGVTDTNLRKVCQESLGALVTGNMDFQRMESVLKQLASQSPQDIVLTASSVLGAALRKIGVDVTDGNVKTLLEGAKSGLVKDQSGDIMRGRIDVSLVLAMMTELKLDATAKFAQPYFESGLTTLCGGATLSSLGNYRPDSVQKVDHVAMLHDENFDVDALLDTISDALGQTRSTIKTRTLRPCAQQLLENAGVDSAGAGRLVTAIFRPARFSSKIKSFLNGLLHNRLNAQLVRDVAASLSVSSGSIQASTMTQATTTNGVLTVLETSRQLWAEVPKEPELPGETKVQSPDTQICVRVITKDSFLKGLSPSPIKGLLRFNSGFSRWTLATSKVRFDMGTPLAAKISVQLLANSSGLIVVGQGTVTDTVLAPYLPSGIVKYFSGLKGTFKAQLNVPLGTAGASGTRRLDTRSTTMQSYGLVSLKPPSFGSDVLTMQGSGQFFFSLNGPLSSLTGTLIKVQGCLSISSNELGMPVGVNAVLTMDPQADYALLTRVEANFKVDLQSVNLGVIEVPTRLKYNSANGSLSAVGRLLNLEWSVPGTDLNVLVNARTTVERSDRNPSTTTKYSFEILGCESNFRLPFDIMPSQPKPTARLRASISVRTGQPTTWSVRGRVEASLGNIIKNPVLELTANSSGLTIVGTAKAQLEFPGDIGIIPASMEVEWSSQTGFRGKANARVPITPASWGINPAIADISYDPVNGLQATASIEDVMDMRSMIPSQSFVDTVAVRASISYPKPNLKVTAYADYTLPSWLGSKSMQLIVDINERGLSMYGSLELGLVLLPSKKLLGHDLLVEKVEVMAVAPWGGKKDTKNKKTTSTTPPAGTSASATLIVEATLGAVFHGVAGFESQFCGAFAMTETPEWLVGVLKEGNLKISTGRAISVSMCEQITLFDYYGDVANRLAAQNNDFFPATAIQALKNVKQVFTSLPARILQGLHVTLPCSVIKGSKSDTFLKAVSPKKKQKFNYEGFFNYDINQATFRVGMGLPTIDLPKVGPILEFRVQANIEASWQIGAQPNLAIRGTLEMKIKLGKENRLHFVGSMAYGTMIEATLELLTPTVIPIVSPRLVLVRTNDFPVRALVRLTITGNLVVEFGGGLLLSTSRWFSMQSGKDDGVNEVRRCNRDVNCYSLQVSFRLDVNIAIPSFRGFKVNARMKPALLTEPELYLALLMVPLPNAAINTLKAMLAPLPVFIGLDLEIGLTRVRVALVTATRWDVFQSDIMMASVFDLSFGKLPDVQLRMAASNFCLGMRWGSNCYGMQVKQTSLSPKIYDDTKALMEEIWGDGWDDGLLPSRLQHRSSVGPGVSAQLQPSPKFQLTAAGTLSAGSLNLAWLGSFNIEVDISPSQIKANVQKTIGGIKREFNLDVRSGLPPSLNKFEFVMDFTGLLSAIDSMASSQLGSTLHKIAKALGVFNSITIYHGRFSISKTTVSLDMRLKVYYEIHLSLTLDMSVVARIIAAKFGDLAKSVLHHLKDKVSKVRPCDCKGPYQSPSEYTYGPYTRQITGRYLPCGTETYYTRSCGHRVWCGVTTHWCGGRRRGWTGPSYPCGTSTHYCCWNVPNVRYRHCTYTVPAVGYHWNNRRRFCNTVTVCPTNLFRTWKYR